MNTYHHSLTPSPSASAQPTAERTPFNDYFKHFAVQNLIDAHQALSDCESIHAHTILPMIFDRPTRVNPPNREEKQRVERMLKRERQLLMMMKRKIANLERECTEMIEELDADGWTVGPGNHWGEADA